MTKYRRMHIEQTVESQNDVSIFTKNVQN